MTFKEFKYWLEGFSEAFEEDGCPNPRQWGKILSRLEEVDTDSNPYPIIVKEINPYIQRPWYPTWISTTGTTQQFPVKLENTSSIISSNNITEKDIYSMAKIVGQLEGEYESRGGERSLPPSTG